MLQAGAGRNKEYRASSKTMTKSRCCVSFQPPLCSSLEYRIAGDRQRHDNYHSQCKGVSQTGIAQNITTQLCTNDDGHEVDLTAGQCLCRSKSTESVSKEQDHCAKNGRQQNWKRHITPVLEGTRAQIF